MKDILTYKNFYGSVHFDSDDQVFHGKIERIEDLVTFEGTSVSKLVELCGDYDNKIRLDSVLFSVG